MEGLAAIVVALAGAGALALLSNGGDDTTQKQEPGQRTGAACSRTASPGSGERVERLVGSLRPGPDRLPARGHLSRLCEIATPGTAGRSRSPSGRSRARAPGWSAR